MSIKDYILLNTAGNLYWKDKNGHYLGCNLEFAAVNQLKSPNDIIGKTDADLLNPFSSKKNINDINLVDQSVINNGEEKVIEETGINAKGEKAYYLTKKSPLKNDQGKIIGLIGTSIDITEKKELEIRKRQFIENMEHDLRTPCCGIYALSDLLKDRVQDPESKEMCQWLSISAKQLTNVINEICKFNITRDEIKREIFNLRDLFETVHELFSAAMHMKGLTFSYDLPSIAFYSDKFRVYQIFLCLLGNAVKFTEKGSITVKFSQDNEFFKIAFHDTGIGIPKDKTEFIFEDFTKLSPSNKYGDDFQGAGLGLHIARKFAYDLHGRIALESKLGRGSVFTLLLPVSLELDGGG